MVPIVLGNCHFWGLDWGDMGCSVCLYIISSFFVAFPQWDVSGEPHSFLPAPGTEEGDLLSSLLFWPKWLFILLGHRKQKEYVTHPEDWWMCVRIEVKSEFAVPSCERTSLLSTWAVSDFNRITETHPKPHGREGAPPGNGWCVLTTPLLYTPGGHGYPLEFNAWK